MNKTGINKRDIIRYIALPEIRPRMFQLFASGFHHISYFMALVFSSVRLLPPSHPYTNPVYVGQYGIRHVIAEAANNLVFSRKNIDQILLFGCILAGIAIVFIQFALLAISLFFQPVLADVPSSFTGFFITPVGAQHSDIAHMMMDMVFGVPGIFNSCVSTAAYCVDMEGNAIQDMPQITAGGSGYVAPMSPTAFTYFPFPIHKGLHQMFQLYSLGLLIVAVIITSYFIFTILMETAQTGTAFGKRFNKVWAPLRFVIAFGLLVPVGYGLNSSQYIVLYAAKFGSGFATNGWNMFNDTLTGTYLGQTANLVTQPSVPEVSTLLQFFFMARVCAELEATDGEVEIKPYLVRGPLDFPNEVEVTPDLSYDIDEVAAQKLKELDKNDSDYKAKKKKVSLLSFADGSTVITMRFGVKEELGDADEKRFGKNKGWVKPICGEVKMNLSDPRKPLSGSPPDPGGEYLQRYYWFILKELWYTRAATDLFDDFDNYPEGFVRRLYPIKKDSNAPEPKDDYKSRLATFYGSDLQYVLTGKPHAFNLAPPTPKNAIQAQIDSKAWNVPGSLRDKGWAGAGIWYNRIAEMNGAVTTAVFNIPNPSRYPEVMEYVRLKKMQHNNTVTVEDQYTPSLSGNEDITYKADHAAVYSEAYKYWVQDEGAKTAHTKQTGNIIVDTINSLFGTEGLYSMRRNPDAHPLAQLVGVGRSLIESAIRNFGYAVIGGAAGHAFKSLEPFFGKLGGAASGFFVTFAMVGLTVGFVLFYIVPFLPFLYFFFAVSGWIKGIFEAMVGAPLWALAHLRIDGEGLPGQAAMNGYFLIFEIFLRPILIIFGMLAGITVFAALVSVLNETFDLVTANLTGFDVRCEQTGCGPTDIEYYRAPVDEFFFTIIYAIIVYLMGLSSFKLIDLIPNNILRWMGQSVTTFNDSTEDPVQGLVGTASIGTQQAVSSIGGGLKKVLGAGGGGEG